MGTSVRGVWGMLFVVALFGVAACTPAASTPTVTPSKPSATTVAPAKPTPAAENKSTAPATAPAKPATSPAAKTAATADWKAEWDKTVEAAKKEGKVIIGGAREETYRQGAMGFQKAYPDIQLEYFGASGSDFAPKILAEREAGMFLWDVQIGGGTTPLQSLKPKGVLDTLRSAQLLPEVTDDSKWLGGFDDGFLDSEGQFFYQFQAYLTFTADANRDLVSEAELNTIEQLVEPKWKGKIVTQDPRSTGATGTSMGYLLTLKGEDWLRKLLAQEFVIMKEGRQVAEAMVRGRFPASIGAPDGDMETFLREGLGANIKSIGPTTEAGARITGGSGGVSLINKAAHPNAAKVFINWLLSQTGQKSFVDATNINSRRLDAPGGLTEGKPDPSKKYINIQKERYQPNLRHATDIAKEIIK